MNLALIHVGPNKRPRFLVVNNNDEVELVGEVIFEKGKPNQALIVMDS